MTSAIILITILTAIYALKKSPTPARAYIKIKDHYKK